MSEGESILIYTIDLLGKNRNDVIRALGARLTITEFDALLLKLQCQGYPPPSWATSPKAQIAKMRNIFGPTTHIPAPPTNYALHRDSALLLAYGHKSLHATLKLAWDNVRLPKGCTKNPLGLKAERLTMRPNDGQRRMGFYWVEFSPNAYRGKSPDQAIKQAAADGHKLAGTEVFWACAMFSEWVAGLCDPSKQPRPSSCNPCFEWHGSTPWLAYIVLLWHNKLEFGLGLHREDHLDDSWACPTIKMVQS
jgi:hypothetical protein